MKFHTLGVTLGAAVLTGAMLTGGALAASADTPAPAPTSSTQCGLGHQLIELWKALPADLQSDIKALRALPKGQQRAEAAKDIRQGALNGKYGADVQKNAEALHGRAFRAYGDMPAALRNDLKNLRAASKSDRPALAKAIGAKALAGDYGTKVEDAVKQIKSADWQNCVAG